VSVKIRLSRFGAKKQPTYRIVVAEERSKRDGRIVEKIGHYDPRTKPATVVMNEERTKYWLSVGARPTDAMGPILKQAGVSDKYVKLHTARKSKSAKAEEASPKPAEPKPEAPAA
jgi:small subunit ribosomal protein S16